MKRLGSGAGDHVDALRNLSQWIWGGDIDHESRLLRSRDWRDALLSNDYSALTAVSLSKAFTDRLKQSTEPARLILQVCVPDDALDMEFLKEGNKPENANSWQTVTDGAVQTAK